MTSHNDLAGASSTHRRDRAGGRSSPSNFTPEKWLGPVGGPVLIVGLAIATFIVDTLTPYEIAAATFYVVVVLLAARVWRGRAVWGVSLGCVALTIGSYLMTRHGVYFVGLINSAISLVAIGATTYLAIRMEAAHDRASRVQADLERIARSMTLSELAASIAHEVKQPLAAISVNANAGARWLAIEPPNLPRAQASIASIVQDAERASEILSRIRELTSGGGPRKLLADPNRLILEVLALLDTAARDRQIEIRTDLAANLPMLWLDPVQFQQVVLNVLVNGMDAIDASLKKDARTIWVAARRLETGEVAITIEDTGVGLENVRTDRMFDAFYSTKPEGMGIGLSICRTILEAHAGHLAAAPRIGGGAIFSIMLPSVRENPA